MSFFTKTLRLPFDSAQGASQGSELANSAR